MIDDKTENNFGKRYKVEHKIKEIRELRGLTQSELADLVGTVKQNIWQIESGRRNLAITQLTKYAKALQCTRAQLLGEEPLDGLEDKIKKPIVAAKKPESDEKYVEYTVEIADMADSKKLGEYNKAKISPYIYKIVCNYYKNSDKDAFLAELEKKNIAIDLFLDFISKQKNG